MRTYGAEFVGTFAQLWLFWVAPVVGGVLGALVYRYIGSEHSWEELAQGDVLPDRG
jgi:glycerol uptake facilitator-like aquaporin